MSIVNFFVVGAAKAGTTSVYHYLSQHPDIFMSPIKEPHFFSTDIRRENFTQKNYAKHALDTDKYFSIRPLKQQHIAFIDKLDDYEALFDQAGSAKVLGETSTGYLYSATAAENIARYNPNAKILIILREPVDRVFSHWKMNLAAGTADPQKPFLATVMEDYATSPKGWGVSNLYIDLSLYHEQVKRYLKLFPHQQVKIMFYEELATDSNKFMMEIFEFLGITPIDISTDEKSNISQLPRFPRLHKMNKTLKISMFIPKKLRYLLKRMTSTTQFPKMITADRKVLYNAFFSDDQSNLSSLIGSKSTPWH